MQTAMHEPNKSWDPGTIVPYMRQGSTSCQVYYAFSKLRHLDNDRTQHHRLFQPKHPNRTGRGGRFGRGGGHSRNKDNSQRAFTAERNEVMGEAYSTPPSTTANTQTTLQPLPQDAVLASKNLE